MSALLELLIHAQPPPSFTVPNPAPTPPPGLTSFGNNVVAWAKWVGILSCVVGVLMCAVMMALGRRRQSEMAAQGAIGIPWVIAAALMVAGAGAIVTGVLGQG